MNRSLAIKIRDNPHLLGHYLGYDKLTDLHDEWIKYCWSDVDSTLQAHRGSYKTISVMVVGTINWMLSHFNDRVLLIRKDFTAASDILKVISRQMNTPAMHTLFIELYGFDYKVICDRSDKWSWNLKTTETREGNINAFGMSANITGSHGDKVLCDDIITLKDKISQAERERTIEYIRELRTNIIDPGQPISFIGTPWHKLDGWSILPSPLKYTINDTHLESFTDEHIKKLKEITTPSLYAINYELKHIASENQMFVDPKFGIWDYRESCVGHIDAKYEGTDTGAFTLFSKTTDPDFPFQSIGFHFNCHIDDYIDSICMLYKKYNCRVIYKEKNDDKGYVVKFLKEKGLNAIGYHESENKHIKISNYIYPIWKKIKWANETDLEYLNQIVDYDEGIEPDDAPDSLGSIIKYGKFVLPQKVSILSGTKSAEKMDILQIKKEERRKIRIAKKEMAREQKEKEKKILKKV
jgi:hypothetical protein